MSGADGLVKKTDPEVTAVKIGGNGASDHDSTLSASAAGPSRVSRSIANPGFPFHTAILVCLVATLGYLTAILGGSLLLHPSMVSPLWPGCALLVSVLLFAPRKNWPILIAAGLAPFVLHDLQTGWPIRSIILIILADAAEVITAAFCLSYFFDAIPRLNNLRSLAKYSFFAVVLAPFVGALVGAAAGSDRYWTNWRIYFFSEALAYLTLLPAILGWVDKRSAWAQKSRAYYLEAAALLVAVVLFGYLTLVAPGRSSSPALFYSLVPVLLWSALRFGSTGVSTSMIVIAFLSIWGATHGRGPFLESEPLKNVLSLQLFLLFAAAPFMVFAALVEERKQGEEELREGEERLRLAVQAGKMYAFEWDIASDVIVRAGQCRDILNWMDDPVRDTGKQFIARVRPDDREAYIAVEIALTPGNPTYQTSYGVLRPDGALVWLEESGHAFFDGQARMLRIIGMVADVTERKRAEEAVAGVNSKLIEAQERERTRIGRELHDDIGQRLAMLAVDLEQVRENPPNLSELPSRIGELQTQTSEIATDIQSLSHELHSSKLELLGVAAAMRGFCREFGQHRNAEIVFDVRDLPSPLSGDISLCLFRVLQEALHNSAKHSGVRRFEVRLWGASDEIHLTVTDSGAGFDREAAKTSPGLGLVSMEERLKLVKGTLSIDSQPKRGTAIHARVPVSSRNDSLRAAG
jgi:signal transduction histidine kinase